MGFRVINGQIYPVDNFTTWQASVKDKTKIEDKPNKSFEDILKAQIQNSKKQEFNISNHAAERINEINLDSADMEKINEGINKAEEKGSKNCLILYKDVAFVTSIENRTIITAVDKNRSKDNVFTNIDSVVLL